MGIKKAWYATLFLCVTVYVAANVGQRRLLWGLIWTDGDLIFNRQAKVIIAFAI